MGRLGKILLVAAFVAYPVLLHAFVLKNEQVEMWQLMLVFSPLLVVGGWFLFNLLSLKWWPLLVLAMAALVYFIINGNHGRIGLLAVNGLSHATINFFLLWLFGRTLLHGREPLIAQISRRLTGSLDPEVVNYTRHVTMAWCIFPASQIIISLALYLFAPLEAWSFFINVLNLPLLILMFVGEKTYRNLRYPNHPRTTIMQAIEVYARDFATPKKENTKRQD